MDQYLYIDSNDSDHYFSDNTVYKFTVHLKTPLPFHGLWKVGLAELHTYIDNPLTRT